MSVLCDSGDINFLDSGVNYSSNLYWPPGHAKYLICFGLHSVRPQGICNFQNLGGSLTDSALALK